MYKEGNLRNHFVKLHVTMGEHLEKGRVSLEN